MDEVTPTASTPRLRWLWRFCWLALVVVAGFGVYLVLTTRPAFYSPADLVRKSSEYERKLNPPRLTSIGTNASASAPPTVTVTTNQGKVRIEYPVTQGSAIEVIGFTLHRLQGGEAAQIGGTSARLKRIGHAWLPPTTNSQSSYHSGVPAQFFEPDLKPIADADLRRELPDRWDRNVDCRDNRPAYRFDLEILGDPWKMLGAALYDARTQTSLTSGWSGQHSRSGYRYSMDPFLWHHAPVELVVDIALGPVEDEEFLPQTGAFFQVGGCRYHIAYMADDRSGGSYSHGSDGKTAYLELSSPTGRQPPRKECMFVYHSVPPAAQSIFELEYLDADGKKIGTTGGGSSGGEVIQGVQGELANIKKIRVRKYTMGHRLVIRLAGLPGLPPENQQVDNLFRVRAPLLKFEREYEQEEYIRRMTQLDMTYVSRPTLPAGTYPRWFTNATPAEVLEDYATVMGVQGQFYVNQEKLMIEKGKLPWPLEAQEKMQKLWKKLRGP